MFKYKSILLVVFLVVLNYSCKRSNLEPESLRANLPQKAQFDKVKSFYENGRYKNQPKRFFSKSNERMTAQDSARFKDFEPQWDKTEVALLPNNEKMLIVPVVRFLSVDYNQNIGFIRRLCIRVDANEDFLEANIVELVGNLTFVKNNYNSIFANYKGTSINGFEGVISVYGLDYTVITQKMYQLGTFTKNIFIEYTHTFDTSTALVMDSNPWSSCGIVAIYGWSDTGGGTIGYLNTCDGTITGTIGGGGSGGGSIGNPASNSPSGGTIPQAGGGSSGNGVGTTGTSNPSPVYTPPTRPGFYMDDMGQWQPLPPKPPTDNGQSFPADGYTYDENGNFISPPTIIIDPTLDNPYHAKIKCVYDKVMAMKQIKQLLGKFRGSGITLTFKVENMDERGQTRYDPIANMYNIDIVINPAMMSGTTDYSHLGIAKTIIHEILHAKIFALIIDIGGMNGSNTDLTNPTGAPTLSALMALYQDQNIADMNRVQHEYIATYQHGLLTSLIAAYDQNRSTQAIYETLAWDGLEETDRYKGPLPNGLGYSDPNMRENRDNQSNSLKDSRKSENPCN